MIAFMLSCRNKNSDTCKKCQELVDDVGRMKNQLPRKLYEGLCLTRVEYRDSTYSLWIEVDDKRYSFCSMDSLMQKRRNEILYDIIVSEGQDRHNYELYVEYNIRMRLIYSGKNDQKQIEFTITPSEINEYLHFKADAYSKLEMLINSTKPMVSEDVKGICDQAITLKDTIVYITITLDESIYDISELKNYTQPNELMAEMRLVNPKLIRYMADAKCGLCYRIIGSLSKKRFEININSKEILFNKIILEADAKMKSEIVESDE